MNFGAQIWSMTSLIRLSLTGSKHFFCVSIFCRLVTLVTVLVAGIERSAGVPRERRAYLAQSENVVP